jgi:hypothetical protein
LIQPSIIRENIIREEHNKEHNKGNIIRDIAWNIIREEHNKGHCLTMLQYPKIFRNMARTAWETLELV